MNIKVTQCTPPRRGRRDVEMDWAAATTLLGPGPDVAGVGISHVGERRGDRYVARGVHTADVQIVRERAAATVRAADRAAADQAAAEAERLEELPGQDVHLVIHGAVCCGAAVTDDAVTDDVQATTCRRCLEHRAVRELRDRRFGIWAGRPAGTPRDPDRCAEEIHAGYKGQQCRRRRGHGPGREYCTQHARRQGRKSWNS